MKKRYIIYFGVLFIFIGWLINTQTLHSLLISDNVQSIEANVGNIPIVTLRAWARLGGFSHDLAFGSKGPSVVILQRALATDSTIYPQGIVSGYLGHLTSNAITRFQQQHNLNKTSSFDNSTRTILDNIFYTEICPSVATTTNPSVFYAHITKEKGIPVSYIPPNLIRLNKSITSNGIVICLRKEVAHAVSAMINASISDGVSIKVCSGYRNPNDQNYLVALYSYLEGPKALNEVALPGHSEHQLGTAVDLTDRTLTCTSDNFKSTPASTWLIKNAYKYGFNLSYPKHETNTDGYIYESWHWRYLGKKVARRLHEENISYDEMTFNQLVSTVLYY